MTTLTQDHAQTAQDLLAAADCAFASGDNLGGSKKMWDAACHAVKAVAQRRGWRCDSREDLLAAARRMDGESDSPLTLRGGFGAAGKFKANSRYDFMESEDDFDLTRQIVRDFISRVLALIDSDN